MSTSSGDGKVILAKYPLAKYEEKNILGKRDEINKRNHSCTNEYNVGKGAQRSSHQEAYGREKMVTEDVPLTAGKAFS